MDYNKIYFSIIEKRKLIKIEGYGEKHHILPKSLGGLDSSDNIIKLTAREHFICHLLLTKMFKPNSIEFKKMIKAFVCMQVCKSNNQDRYITSHSYETLKKSFSRIQSQEQTGSGNSQFGLKWIYSDELKQIQKIKFDELLPTGWKYGRKNFKLEELRIQKEQEKINLKNKKIQDIKLQHLKMYEIYKMVGFEEFVKQTNYKFSKPNLVQKFSKYVDEFIPQNGKSRNKNGLVA